MRTPTKPLLPIRRTSVSECVSLSSRVWGCGSGVVVGDRIHGLELEGLEGKSLPRVPGSACTLHGGLRA